MEYVTITKVVNGYTVCVDGINEVEVYVFDDLESALECVAEKMK